ISVSSVHRSRWPIPCRPGLNREQRTASSSSHPICPAQRKISSIWWSRNCNAVVYSALPTKAAPCAKTWACPPSPAVTPLDPDSHQLPYVKGQVSFLPTLQKDLPNGVR